MTDPWQTTLLAQPVILQREIELALEHLFAACDAAQQARYEALQQHPTFGPRLAKLLSCSSFAAQLCRRFPAWLLELHDSGDLDRNFTADEWPARAAKSTTENTDALDRALRQFRNREYLRILWRDLNRIATMSETTADISSIAETCIQVALDFHQRDLQHDWGTPLSKHDNSPQPFIVLGMGKLGARELNLSSDIDLIFAFPDSGETSGGAKSVSNQEFFVRLGQRLIKSLDQNTADGFVFRVDMRLRPYGDSGGLVLNFDALEEYYQDQGRDWERYAMIKARPVAESFCSGEFPSGKRLIDLLRPFTYRRYLDYSAFESLREMKALIERDVQRRRLHDNIKLGAGGIREIEFTAQCFQLIRGGREPRLQERNLQSVLTTLGELGHLPLNAVDDLQSANIFLRNTEHAIQAWLDQQTQELPKNDLPRAALANAMGFNDWTSFVAALDHYRNLVDTHFHQLIALPTDKNAASATTEKNTWLTLWADNELSQETLKQQFENAKFDNAEEAARRTIELKRSKAVKLLQSAARERLDTFMPKLLVAVTYVSLPGTALLRILPLVEKVLRRSAYLVLLVENPAALKELVVLCAASPWVASQLALHPVLLDELLNAGTLYVAPEKSTLQRDLQQQLLRFEWSDLEGRMEALRYFKLAHVLRVVAAEIGGTLPLMKVSDYLTWIAETILEQVLEMAWRYLIERHGRPQHSTENHDDKNFIIVAYGKLGGIELGHGSDIDLVFIHDTDASLSTDGATPIDNGTFFTRLGQRIIHILTTQTTLGPLYEVDMRLRPSGNSGLLVSSLKSFADYQHNRAWTWEHQALVRARAVAGDADLSNAFEQVRRDVLCKKRDDEKLRKDVIEMRDKMRTQLRPRDTETEKHPVFDLKQGSGAIVDIEFMVQYFVLKSAHTHPALTHWTDNIRILETLQNEQLLNDGAVQNLINAYKVYRSATHRMKLQEQPSRASLNEFANERHLVTSTWSDLFGIS
ncbi:MAG: glutamine synthetase adenylyltransferase [Verrucomicrobiaceae bacterium]|nr:glutamine synthetase adenylyltransferase [Verrucomicrobiaceae bacterium]